MPAAAAAAAAAAVVVVVKVVVVVVVVEAWVILVAAEVAGNSFCSIHFKHSNCEIIIIPFYILYKLLYYIIMLHLQFFYLFNSKKKVQAFSISVIQI